MAFNIFKYLIHSTTKKRKLLNIKKTLLRSNSQHFELLQKYDKTIASRKDKFTIVQEVLKFSTQLTIKLTKFKLNNETNDISSSNENEYSDVIVQRNKFKDIINLQHREYDSTENIIDDKSNKYKIIKINYSLINNELHQELVEKIINQIESDEDSLLYHKSLNALKEQHEKLIKYLKNIDIKDTIEKSKDITAIQIKIFAAKIKQIMDSPHTLSIAKIVLLNIIVTMLHIISADLFAFKSELLGDGNSVSRKIMSACLYDYIFQLPISILIGIVRYILEQYFRNERVKKLKTITKEKFKNLKNT